MNLHDPKAQDIINSVARSLVYHFRCLPLEFIDIKLSEMDRDNPNDPTLQTIFDQLAQDESVVEEAVIRSFLDQLEHS
jgi:hypothetical protein